MKFSKLQADDIHDGFKFKCRSKEYVIFESADNNPDYCRCHPVEMYQRQHDSYYFKYTRHTVAENINSGKWDAVTIKRRDYEIF